MAYAIVAGVVWTAVCLALPLGTGEAAIRPRYGGRVVRGFIGRLTSIHPDAGASPVEREAIRQVHAGLYRHGADGQPEPDLVEKTELIDGSTVRLTLRTAWFHDGSPVMPADAVASVERFVRGPGIGRLLARDGGPGDDLAEAAAPPRPVARIGELPRSIVLDVAAAPTLWPWLLASHRAVVLPVDGNGLVGAGPFRVVRADFDAREPLELAPYARHHRGRPLLDQVVYRRFDNARALAFAHRHQDVDVIDVTAAAAELPPAAAGTASETLLLWINAKREPLGSLPLRSRILAAIGRPALVDVVLGGRAELATGILRPRPSGPVAPTQAAAPSDAGTTRGTVRTLSLGYPTGMELEDVADRIIRVDLPAGGFRARALPLDPPALARAMATGALDLALVVHPGGGVPGVVAIAELSGLLGREPSASLRRAALADPGAATPADTVFAAEADLLSGGEVAVLLRRDRRLFVRDTVHDTGAEPGASALLEAAWRWPLP